MTHYVPLLEFTHKCGIDANAHRPSQNRFESRGESQLMTFDLESGGDARSLDSPAKSDLDGVMWKKKPPTNCQWRVYKPYIYSDVINLLLLLRSHKFPLDFLYHRIHQIY